MSSRSEILSPAQVLGKLQSFPPGKRYFLGFSGGADSSALLQALCEIREEATLNFSAIHFNHGLHEESDRWQAHCEAVCRERGIPIECVRLDLGSGGDNLEARARDLRYGHVDKTLRTGDVYLTAHQADDQAETFLLHALRGSGPDGLAGIPECRRLGAGWVARPMLDVSRQAIEEFLEERNIHWIEDQSNEDCRFDRNFLRHKVLPLLASRWPAASRNLANSARLSNQAGDTLNKLLFSDFGDEAVDSHVLSAEALLGQGDAYAALMLRSWLRFKNVPGIPKQRLETFIGQLSGATSESLCEARWAGWSLRHFCGEVHLVPPEAAGPCPEVEWTNAPSVFLGAGTGHLRLIGPAAEPAGRWSVAPRRPGAKMRIDDTGPSRTLKNLFRESSIPPWQRGAIPVLYWGRNPVAVGDWLLSSKFRSWLDQRSLRYEWLPDDELLAKLRASHQPAALTGEDQ